MTLQVALMASDGWLLASDRRSGEYSNPGDDSAAFVARDVRKIELVPDCQLAFACAGAEEVRQAGAALVRRLRTPASSFNWSDLQNELTRLAMSSPSKMALPFGFSRLTVALFNIELQIPQLWTVDFARQGMTPRLPEIISEWTLAGDFNNGARLLPQLYYSKRSCRELTRLAAWTILFAGLFNPSSVSGVDVLIGENGSPARFLSDKELNQLRDEFQDFHALVGQRLK